MRFSAVAMIGLMVAAGAAAQQAKAPVVTEQQQKTTVILLGTMTALSGSDCPGVLQARRQAMGGGTVWTTALGDEAARSTARPKGLGVHVEFQDAASAVKALELRVSYLPPGLREIPVTSELTNVAAKRGGEQEKTFNVDRAAAKRISADLLVGPAATITTVRLVSITFADGSEWREPTENACVVVPSGMMLVAAK